MGERVVAVSYAVDGDTRAANVEVLGDRAEVVFLKDLAGDERASALARAEVLVSWSLPRELDSGELGGADALRFLQLLSAGVDHVDLGAIPESVLLAGNVGAWAEPMAEHVMAMTLSLAKRLPQRHAALAAGRWDQYLPSLTLRDAVCGIVGFGGIGRATAGLMRPFGAHIWALNTSGHTNEDVAFVGTFADLDHVLEAADVLVLAVPLTRATRGLIGARELGLMKSRAILVNVARGDVVDEKALYDHLCANPDFCAALDTWWREPARNGAFRTDYPFFDLPNLLGSPHNSALVPGIIPTAARRAAENVARYLAGEPVTGVVRREDYATA